MRFLRVASSLAVVAATLGAAGCALRQEDAPTQPMIVQLDFASLDAAVVPLNIELYVFDAEGQTDACATIQAARVSTNALPAYLTSKTAGLCDYYRGTVKLASDVGERALYAIAYDENDNELFAGCVQQYVGDGDAAALPITMSRSGNLDLVVRFGGCTSMAQRCTGNGC